MVARGQCLSSLTPKVLLNFGVGWPSCLTAGGNSAKANITILAVNSGDSQDHLSHNSRKRQTKIDAQAAEIATMKTELNKALQEK